jgi:hypothetical protein
LEDGGGGEACRGAETFRPQQTNPPVTTMNAFRSLPSGVLAGASLLLAVATSAGAAETGLIGKRHAGLDLTYDHFSGSRLDKAFGAAAEANLPLARAFDLQAGYAYADTTGDNHSALEKRLSAGLLTHRQTEYGTAYFAGALGHAWHSADVLGVGSRHNGVFWGVRAGYEIALGARTALDAGLGFTDSFEDPPAGAQVVSYRAAVNHWFSGDLAGVLGVAYRQIKAAPDAIRYSAALRWAF